MRIFNVRTGEYEGPAKSISLETSEEEIRKEMSDILRASGLGELEISTDKDILRFVFPGTLRRLEIALGPFNLTT